MEGWNIGMLAEDKSPGIQYLIGPLSHYSIIPTFQVFINPTTIHKVIPSRQQVFVSDERDKLDDSSSVSMIQAQ